MVGFVELFLLWLGLAIWAGILSRQDGAPRFVGAITWVTGTLLGGSIIFGAWGLVSMLGGGEPEGLHADALSYATYAAYVVLLLGYLAILGATGSWYLTREARGE